MGPRQARGGFTLVELVLSLSVVSMLLAILLPTLSSARMSSRRALCAGNQRVLGQAWSNYLDSNQGRFPVVYDQAAWMYGAPASGQCSRLAPGLRRFATLELWNCPPIEVMCKPNVATSGR